MPPRAEDCCPPRACWLQQSRGTPHNLSPWSDGAYARTALKPLMRPERLGLVGNSPNLISTIFANEHAAIGHLKKTNRPAPHFALIRSQHPAAEELLFGTGWF